MNRTHELKILESFATDIVMDRKTFEVRKNDRGFQKGDYVEFTCIENENHSINGWGIEQGYVVFGIKEKGVNRMRLIDADKIDFNEVFVGASKFAEDTRQAGKMLIDAQPTAYDVDKVVHEINNKIQELDAKQQLFIENGLLNMADKMASKIGIYIECREIVEKAGEEDVSTRNFI